MKELIKNTKMLWFFIMAISFIGCNDDDDANLPELVASFAHTINEDTGAVSFLNLSENADSYTWDFGDGTTSTEINPIRSFPTGTYTIELSAKNAAGASGKFTDEIVIDIPLPINFPINFDDPNVKYDITTFSGVAFEIVDNPDASGTNTSTSKVGAITNSGAAFEGFFFDLGMPLDLTTLKSVKVNFWSDTPIDVLLKLEQGTGADAETSASHGGTGWEEIIFNFSSDASYSRFTMFVDGSGTTAGTFYIDDITQIETPAATSGCTTTEIAATALPLNFEGCETFPSADNFGAGITSELASNPSKTGINTSDFVLKVDKPTGSDFFAGIQNTFASNFDLTTTNVFKAKVYSTKAGVIFRFELLANPNDGSIGNPAPVFVTVPTADEWIEVEFTFTGLPAGPTAYNQLVIKPDNDQADSAITDGGTYYFDDISLSESGGGGSTGQGSIDAACTGSSLQDFETADNSIFGDFGGGTAVIVDNPNTTVNTSAKVGQMQKFAGEVFGGTTMSLDAPQDFANGEVFTMDVFSQRASALTFKLEGLNIEKVITTAGTGWETMTFDFTGETGAAAVPAITLIFDNGTNGDAAGDPDAWTFLFDSLRLCDSGGGSTGQGSIDAACTGSSLQDFETADNSIFGDFGGGTAVIVDNPNTTVNTSAKVGQMQKFAGEVFGGTTMSLDAPQDFANGEVFTMDVFSQRASALTFKLEGLNIEKVITTAGTGWETMTFDFTGETGAAAVPAITLIFDNGTNGDAAGDPDAWTFLFDNLRLCDSGGGGGGTCPAPPAGDLVSNGDFETGTDSCWNVFQNGGTAVLDNTISNGGTWSGKLATNGPSNPAFKQEGIGVGTVIAGDVVQITFDHIGSVVQPGAVFNVLLFGEGAAPGASFTHVFSPAPALTGSWTTFTGTFTIPAGTDVTGGISFLIEAVCGGDAGCSVSANIDNVSVTLNP